MEYGFTRPQEIKEPEHVFRGSELHLSRELQTEDYIGIFLHLVREISVIYYLIKNVI